MQTMVAGAGTWGGLGLVSGRTSGLVSRRFVMEEPLGLHARPSALLVKTALRYDADITVSKKGGHSANGKSIMGLLTLQILYGDEFTVTAEGWDAEEAIQAIAWLLGGPQGQAHLTATPVITVPAPPASNRSRPEASLVCV